MMARGQELMLHPSNSLPPAEYSQRTTSPLRKLAWRARHAGPEALPKAPIISLQIHPIALDGRFRVEFLGVWTGFLLAERAANRTIGEELPAASHWLLFDGESSLKPIAGFERLETAFGYVAMRLVTCGLSPEAIADNQRRHVSLVGNGS
jgi:hypothetical protein